MPQPELNAVVSQRIEVSPGLAILRIVPLTGELPDFEPGQFAVIALRGSAPRHPDSDPEEELRPPDRLIKRAYSIASSSVQKEYIEFYVALVRSGALTPRLFALEPGDRLWLSTKASGLFTLDEVPEDRHVVLVGTGTGLAPYLSMLRTRLVCGGPRRFGVIHGARHSWDLGYRSELMAIQRLCSNFTYVPAVSRPDEEPVAWSGASGRLQEVWKSRILDDTWGFRVGPGNSHIFLCGNPSMIRDMGELLSADGFREHGSKEPGELHVEKYW